MEFDRKRFEKVAYDLFNIVQNLPSYDRPRKIGGVLTLAGEDLKPLKPIIVGNQNQSNIDKYFNFSREKIYRVIAHGFRDSEAVSSWQTRDEDKDMYGGAILLPEMSGAISFSGLSEHGDEVLAFATAIHAGGKTINERYAFDKKHNFAERIVDVSKNPLFEEMTRAKII